MKKLLSAALWWAATSGKLSTPQAPLAVSYGTPHKIITPAVSSLVNEVIDRTSIPGLSIGTVQLSPIHEPVVQFSAWGNRTEDGDELTPNALFAMASCSKAFLVTAVGLLIDDYAHGRNATPLPGGMAHFDWDTKVRDLLTGEWGMSDEWAEKKLSLRDAFSHVSGMPRHDYAYRPGDTTDDIVRRLHHLPDAFELREQFAYNNHMFMMGAHLVSKLAGVPYATFVEARIFTPLNMTATTFSPSAAAKTGMLTQTWTETNDGRLRRIPFWFSDEVATLFAGAGGIISSADDMVKWIAMLLNGGVDPHTNVTVVPPSVIAETTAARTVFSGVGQGPISLIGYGMGWFRMSYRGHEVVWHFGAIPGFSLLVALLPSDHFGAVILANVDEKLPDNLAVLYRLIDEALSLGPLDQADRPWPDPSKVVPFPPPGALAARGAEGTSVTDKQAHQSGRPPLSRPLEEYAGTYQDGMYGNITLCAPSSTSPTCVHVRATFAAVDAASTSASASTAAPDVDSDRPALLLGAWPRVWSSHMRLRHVHGDSFAATFPRLFTHGYGRERAPFEFLDSQLSYGRAEFVVRGDDGRVEGFALITDELAAGARARRGLGPREIGDAWFVKVE